jgi:succinoglycan biosynthesis protein ExoM
MSSKPLTVDICIATYKRPSLLKQLLQTIESQEGIKGGECSLIIIDNDCNQSASSTVAEFSGKSQFKVTYEVEPQQNIALARNRAINISVSDYIIFIDDDEEPIPTWVSHLVTCAQKYNADVVFGPVVPILPKTTPEWIIDAKLFTRLENESGTRMNIGGTGNTLVRKTALDDYKGPFDIKFGLTGGSDSELFNSMNEDGKEMVWCDSAEVHEKIEASRMNLKYILLRAFRVGQCFARVKLRYKCWYEKIGWLLYRLSLVLAALVLTSILLPFGRKYSVKPTIKIFTNLGQISSLTGYKYKEYSSQPYTKK